MRKVSSIEVGRVFLPGLQYLGVRLFRMLVPASMDATQECALPSRCGATRPGDGTRSRGRELFFGFPDGTRPLKRWHKLSERKIAELRNG
jgi:hypothetical protein